MPPSKSHRMEKGRRIQSTQNAGARARFALSKWTRQVRRHEAGEWTSRRPRNFAAGCSDLKLNLAAARFRGNMVLAEMSQAFKANLKIS